MTVLTRYVTLLSLRNSALVLSSFAGLLLLLGYADESSRRISADYQAADALFYVLYTLPAELYIYTPILLALAAVITFAGLAKNSELVIMRSLSTSSAQLLTLLILPFWLIGLVFMLAGELYAPSLKVTADETRAELRGRAGDSGAPNWHQSENWLIYADYIDPSSGTLTNPQLLNIENGQLKLTVSAPAATPKGNGWALASAQILELTDNSLKTVETDFNFNPATLTPPLLALLSANSESLTLTQLWHQVQYSLKENRDNQDLIYNLWKRCAFPFVLFTVLLLAVAFSMGSFRQKSIGEVAFKCLASALIFTTLFDLVSGILSVYDVPAGIAVMIPLLLTNLLLLQWTRHQF